MTSVIIQAAVTGIEPVSRRLTAVCPYQHGLHRNVSYFTWLTTNCVTRPSLQALLKTSPRDRPSRIYRHCHDRLSTRTKKHPAGVEPAPPPWRDGTLPLRHGCVKSWPNCQRTGQSPIARLTFMSANIRFRESKSTGWDSNPRCRITGAVSWPLNDQCN